MAKRLNGTRLTNKDIREIRKLRTEGCPCCKQPITGTILAEKYGCSTTTVSRIATGLIVPSDEDAAKNGAGPQQPRRR